MKLYISPIFILMGWIMLLLGWGGIYAVYLLSIILHEMAHALVARRRGLKLSQIKLMPYGASLSGDIDGAKWTDEILIAIAGPVLNLIIIVVTLALWWVFPPIYAVTESLLMANISIVLLNILPIYPLDGGRVALAVASKFFPRKHSYKLIRYISIILGIALSVLLVIYSFSQTDFSFVFIIAFILTSTLSPDKLTFYRRSISGFFRSAKLKKGVAVQEYVVSGRSTPLEISKMCSSNCFNRFRIVDDSCRTIAVIDELQLEQMLKLGNYNIALTDSIHKC